MKFIGYIFFRLGVFAFSWIPFPVLHILSDGLYIILRYLLGYRKSVIEKNISHCFPKKSQEERNQIRDRFYRHFSDILFESIKGLSINPHRLVERFKMESLVPFDHESERGSPVTLYSQHYNNWEWGPICLGLQVKHHIVGIVKELHNPYINDFITKGRTGNNVSVVTTYKTPRYYLSDLSNTATVYIADQNPYFKERSVTLDFFGNPTRFHNGAASFACRAGFPVYTLDIRKTARSKYAVSSVLLHPNPSEIKPEELTEIYKNHLEQLISEAPEYWLWSHKRFKDSIDY